MLTESMEDYLEMIYRLLQKKSMDLRLPIKTVAEAVIKQDFSL